MIKPSMPQDFGHEVTRPLFARRIEDLRRRAHLHDLAVSHERDLGRDLANEAHLMTDDQHGHAVARKHPDCVEHLGHEFRIERRRHLVEQQDLGLQRKRACDGDALLLPA